MHISLDSALGRQRRLNSVGESVLQIAPDAAAAYSLRSLTGGDPDVVRVRRESDNTEKDFSGSQIESGEMARWVNEQPTLPLDLRELDTNTGERDGALIEAAAAYSLRKLKEDFTGDVVEVRRSSDDAVQSFTASEVTDGTMEAWVDTDVTIYQSNFSSSIDGWSGGTASPVGNQDGVSDGTTSKDNVLKLTKAQDSQAYIQRDQGVIAGLTYTVSGSFYAPSSNTGVDGILIKDGIAGSSLSSYPSGYLTASGVWTDFSFSYTATVSGNQRINMGISSLGSNPNGSSAGSAGDVVYISDLQFVETTSNGHVRTWYDQSGNTNDATQTDPTKQPKIVDGGTYLGEVDFDGTSELASSSSVNVARLATAFSVVRPANLGANKYIWTIGGTSGIISYIDSTERAALAAGSPLINGTLSTVDNSLKFDFCNTANSIVAINGSSGSSGTIGIRSGNDVIKIGSRGGADFMYGSISEIIIYDSDQSDNRTAIEANIGETYGITGIPAANDTVNGFVQTWYDQSGNGDDAEQSAAANQPKIVDSGALVTRNINGTVSPSIKFGASNKMIHGITSLSADGQQSLFFVADNQVTSGDSTRLLEIMSTSDDSTGRNRRPLIYQDSSQNIVFSVDTLGGIQVTAANSDQVSAYSSITDDTSGGTHTVYQDGTQVGSATVTLDANPTLSTSHEEQLGHLASNAVGNFYFTEIVYYNSDQSSNRPAIESNIANQYGITLS